MITGSGTPPLIPDSRLTVFQPGVTYNGGITNRTVIAQTLSPKGGNSNVSIAIGTPTVVTGLGTTSTPAIAAGNIFIFQTTGQLPTGILANSEYFVTTAGLGTNSFQFSATSASGAAVNSSGTQSGIQGVLLSDTAQINTACNNVTQDDTRVIFLNPGTFTITGNGVNITTSKFTLRGSGVPSSGSAIVSGKQGPATAAGTYTALWKADSNLFGNGNSPFGCLYVNQFAGQFINFGTSFDLTADAVKGNNFCDLVSVAGLSTGMLVLVDHNTENDPLVYWGHNTGSPGAAFIGSVSGTALTISSFNTTVSPNFTINPGDNVFYSQGLVGTIASGSGVNWTLQSPGPTITNGYMESGNGSRRFFCRQSRSLCQMMKIAGINGNRVTFETIFHITHPITLKAQLVIDVNSGHSEVTKVGIENLYIYAGVGGDANGNLPFAFCSYCWAKNVESHWSNGSSISHSTSYRCEVRGSYMHESPVPNPGGGGYLCSINFGSADCLFEDNAMVLGNKVNVGRSSGGGNVVAYNYMDDPMDFDHPMSPEAGVNFGHFTTSHFDLIEGNYSHMYKGDDFWGNTIYTTVFRNWFSGLRAGNNIHTNFPTTSNTTNASSGIGTNTLHFTANTVNGPGTSGMTPGFLVFNLTNSASIPPGTTILTATPTAITLSANILAPGVGNGDLIQVRFDGTLNNYTYYDGQTTTYPYIDSWGRSCCDIEAHSFNHNIAGNVLGFNGQVSKGFGPYGPQIFVYENLGPNFSATGSSFEMYTIFIENNPSGQIGLTGQDATILRQGNWDWFTHTQRWHGIGGLVGSGQVVPIPNSYYLTSKPAFWGATPWPWVHPENGGTDTLPAKARFEAMTGVTTPIPPGNQ